MPLPPSTDTDCPFCAIAASTPPLHGPGPISPSAANAHILLATPHILAFLDHAPISRGHVLIATRQHREKLGDISVEEGRALGAWLGVLSRAVVGSVKAGGDTDRGRMDGTVEDVGDWNVVQNNGARAAQVVPHVHFHIIPRGGDVPEVKARSWTIFGRGQREDLDEDDAVLLIQEMRGRLERELARVAEREGDKSLEMLWGEGKSGAKL